jgi:hypothetical protein
VLLPITIPNPCLEEQVFIEYKVNLALGVSISHLEAINEW